MEPMPFVFAPLPAFTKFMETYRLPVIKAGVIILGFSGGADSSCLLYHLLPWCRENGVRLIAAHVHHGIRGEEADLDEVFCRQTAQNLGIEYYATFADVPALAEKEKAGLEEMARRVRYDFFRQLSLRLTGAENGAIIVTAHNADDNLETVLFHLLRGSGLGGLCGIDPFREGQVLRPLLEISGEDIRTWCQQYGIAYVNDATNTDIAYTRNRIRHRIVPALAEISVDPAAAVTRLTSILRQDNDFLQEEAQKAYEKQPLTRKDLAALHPAVASRVLHMLYEEAKDTDATLEEKHIRRSLELIGSTAAVTSLSLPGKMKLLIERDTVRILPDMGRRKPLPADKSPSAPIFSYPADGERCTWACYSLDFSQEKHNVHPGVQKKDENIYKLSILTILRFDKIMGELKVRFRCPGDRYAYGGMTHKVKRLFSDRKLSAEEKNLWPLLCDDSGILWIPGFPPRDEIVYRGEGEPLTLRFTISGDNKTPNASEEL